MARGRGSQIREALCKLIPQALVVRLAWVFGAVQRRRKIAIGTFVWALVLGFSGGRKRTIAGLRRAYEKVAGHTIEESSFYQRFNEGLVALLKALIAHVLEATAGAGRALRGHLEGFRDVVMTDSTVVRLHMLLERAFPACRTNHTKAALKAHVVLGVRGAGDQSVKVTSERVHDGPVFTVGGWVRDKLLLFDLGYFRYQLFACITRNGGYFLTRLKGNADPLIVAQHRSHRGRARKLVGRRLREVLPGMQRQVLDIEVEVRFPRRRYAGRVHRDTQRLRVVGILDDRTNQYHLYITNVPAEKLRAEDIGATYALRWQIELLFKELKSHYRLEDMPSSKRVVVEGLLHVAILTLLVSRRLLALVRARLAQLADRIPDQRWAAVFAAYAGDLLVLVTRPPRDVAAHAHQLQRAIFHEAVDPNRNRPGLLADIEGRNHALARTAL